MAKFFFEFKKLQFWPIFPILGAKKLYPKLWLYHIQPFKGFYQHAKVQGNLMIQFYENTQTDDRSEGWTDPFS